MIRPHAVSPQFLAYALRTPYFVETVVSRSVGVSYPAINASEIGFIELPLPSLLEQQAIAAFLDCEMGKIDALIDKKKRLVELLREKRTALISSAVTKGLNPTVKFKPSGVQWLGDVPEHWVVSTFKRISKRIVVGIAEAATQAYSDEGIPILRATNIRPGRIIGELLYLDPEFANAEERKSKKLKAGDLVTVRTGNAGVTAIIPEELNNCHCFTMLVTSLNSHGYNRFYEYYISSHIGQSYFSIEGWGTAQVNISVPILQNLPIPLPPMFEQQEIVDYLDNKVGKIDMLVSKIESVIEKLTEYRTALISAAVTGKIDVRDAI